MCACVTEKKDNHVYTNENAKALNKVPFLPNIDSLISSLDTRWNGLWITPDEWLSCVKDWMQWSSQDWKENIIIETKISVLILYHATFHILPLCFTNLCRTMQPNTSSWLPVTTPLPPKMRCWTCSMKPMNWPTVGCNRKISSWPYHLRTISS